MAALCRLVLAALLVVVPARGLPAWADDTPPIVVELFTSQGCNSCPPADAYLGELAARPGLLALAFHVDYWNYIGWADPFARAWATARQRAYQKSLNQRFVYTPQMVVNGAAQGIGSDRDAIEALIRAAQAARPAVHPDLALRRRKDGTVLVEIGAGASPAGAPADIWLVGYDRPHHTQVLRGENGGQTLTDYQTVRSYRRLGGWPGWSLELVIPPAEASSLGDGGIAVLVQAAGLGPVLAAARTRCALSQLVILTAPARGRGAPTVGARRRKDRAEFRLRGCGLGRAAARRTRRARLKRPPCRRARRGGR